MCTQGKWKVQYPMATREKEYSLSVTTKNRHKLSKLNLKAPESTWPIQPMWNMIGDNTSKHQSIVTNIPTSACCETLDFCRHHLGSFYFRSTFLCSIWWSSWKCHTHLAVYSFSASTCICMPVSVEEAYMVSWSSKTQVNAFSYDICHTSVLSCGAGNSSWHKIKKSSKLREAVFWEVFSYLYSWEWRRRASQQWLCCP
jgi:hypothetical protein